MDCFQLDYIRPFSQFFPRRRRLVQESRVGVDLRKLLLFADTHQSWLHSSFRNCTVGCSSVCSAGGPFRWQRWLRSCLDHGQADCARRSTGSARSSLKMNAFSRALPQKPTDLVRLRTICLPISIVRKQDLNSLTTTTQCVLYQLDLPFVLHSCN